MKKFENVDYHYVYTVNFDTKTVMEYQVKDYDTDPENCYTHFPYAECGFEDPFALVNDSEWTCVAFDGSILE